MRSPPATTRRTTAAPRRCGPRSPRTSPRRSRPLTSSSRRPLRRSPSSSASARGIHSRCTSPTTARCRCRWRGSPRSRSRRAWRSPRAQGGNCPSAFRSRARRSATPGCWTRPTPWSARSASRRWRRTVRGPRVEGTDEVRGDAHRGRGARGGAGRPGFPAARDRLQAHQCSGARRGRPSLRTPEGPLRSARRPPADHHLPPIPPLRRGRAPDRPPRDRTLLRRRRANREGLGARMTDYEPVIGLEIHVQLSTRTKMFCGCSLSFGDEPNTHTCPVCLGHPGTLPTMNEQAIRYALIIAAALECDAPDRSEFARKNYFYPDLPKGYQISQYDQPIAVNGKLGDVRIHRAHLEEDAAKLTHVGESGRIHGSGASLVDFNRGGTPLVEIVTEPDLRTAAEAREWAQLLRTTILQLGASDVNMEEGSLRVDGNISVRPVGSEELGVKTELKNMNSFRFLERGIEAELARQRELLEGGEEVDQETLHFHPEDGSLTPLRSKEYAHDYRYFPEPDLVPVAPTEEMLQQARESLPELPAHRRERYISEVGLSEEAASTLAFHSQYGEYFERAMAAADGTSAKALANWGTGGLAASLRQAGGEDAPLASRATPEAVASLAGLVEAKTISHGAGKQVLATLVDKGGDPAEIVEAEGLAQISDSSELEAIVDRAIEAEAEAADEVRNGNEKAIGRIVGAAMRESKGRADGGAVLKLIKQRLG